MTYLASLDYSIDFSSLFIWTLVAMVFCIPLAVLYHLEEIGFITKNGKKIIREEAQECFSVIIMGICIMCGNNFKIGLALVVFGLLHVIVTNIVIIREENLYDK